MKIFAKLFSCILLTSGQVACGGGVLNPADVITGTPIGSWAYSQQINYLGGINNEFFVTTTAQLSGAVFDNFVTYDPHYPPTGILFDPPNSLNVFTTYATSPIDQTFNIHYGFDDGKSFFLDDVFISGGGFSAGGPLASLSLTANVAKKITVAVYNGDGNGSFGFGRDAGGFIVGPIDGFNGITIHATGAAAVPEPASAVLWAIGGLAAFWMRRRSRTQL